MKNEIVIYMTICSKIKGKTIVISQNQKNLENGK